MKSGVIPSVMAPLSKRAQPMAFRTLIVVQCMNYNHKTDVTPPPPQNKVSAISFCANPE